MEAKPFSIDDRRSVSGHGRGLFACLAVPVLIYAAQTNTALAQYTEGIQVWFPTLADAWHTVSLASAPYSVPANAVVEIVVRNIDTSNELWGGVRAVGSSLDRRFQLQEAEDGGRDRVTMHVQADASSQVQFYADDTTNISFLVAGYWTSGTYVEWFDTFTAGASASWQDRNLCTYGVRPGYVAEIAMTNDDALLARSAGVRIKGSSLERRISIRNAEAGGVDAVSMMVKADASATATVQLYAEDDADVDFYLVGYWSVAPGAYTELFVDVGSPALDATWTDLDLTASGVPNSAVAEFVLGNEDVDEENNMGVRANGSALGRVQLLVEAEDGGADTTSTHVQTDGTATIEFYHDDVSDDHTFRLVGYWTTCDTSISYTVLDLGAVTASNKSLGWHINGSEHVAGFEENASGNPAAWLLNCGTFSSLSTLGGSYAESHGINDSDMVVGWSHNGAGKRRAFRWTSGGGMVDLGVASSRTDSEAQAVNSSSQIVGTVFNFGSPPSNRLAFLYLPADAYTLTAGMNSLGTLGGTQSEGMDINDFGRVVGGAQNASGYYRPFRWNSGTMTDLGTLGGDVVTPDHRAEAVNSSGNIVGRSYTAGGAARAFYWNGTTMSNLGVLTGGTESWAFGINDSNVAVGASNVTGGAYHAFVWDGTNGLRDLNSLISGSSGWTLIRATDINNDGFITGWGTNGSGDTRAFLLTSTCYGGGGGAVAASAAVASGSGVTDQFGTFEEIAVDSEGMELARIEVLAGSPGMTLEYQIIEPNNSSIPMPEPNQRTGIGFVDGVCLARTLRVETAGPSAEALISVSMYAKPKELTAIGVAPDEFELYVFEKSAGAIFKSWVPAGRFLGELPPTGMDGDSGFVRHGDGTLEYWAEKQGGGVFAVGKGGMADQSVGSPTSSSRPCGVGMIQSLVCCGLVLSWMRASRRT